MKKKLTHNLFLKILSLVFAFILWLMVVIVTDPYKTVIISDVPIKVINEDEITEQGIGQIYSIISPQDRTVSVKVYGQKSKVDKLTAHDINAVVDFGVVSSVGAAYIEVSEPDGVTVMSKTPEMMKIDIEALEEKAFDVSLEISGVAAEGYIINDASIFPNMTKIVAPESLMSKIAKVSVMVDVSGLSSDINSMSKIALYDASGKMIDYDKDERISLSVSDVQTHVETYMIKEVPLNIELSGEMQENLVLMSASYSPETVLLKGRKEDLNALDVINIPADSNFINLGQINKTTDMTLDISAYIPSGIDFLNDGGNMVTAHFEVKKIVDQTFAITVDDIDFSNAPKDCEIIFVEPSQIIPITVRGYEEDIRELTLESIAPYINLIDAVEGSSFYKIRVRTSSLFELVGEPIVNIIIKPVVEETMEEPVTEPVSGETTVSDKAE